MAKQYKKPKSDVQQQKPSDVRREHNNTKQKKKKGCSMFGRKLCCRETNE
jgi:hypothetical protein